MKEELLDGKYELKERLGTGGFASIYRGWDRLLDKEVAIKIILSSLSNDEKFVRMFLDEGYTVSKLVHPNIVHISDIGQDKEGLYYLVMEYVEGYNLSQIVMQSRKIKSEIPLRVSAFIISEICNALHYAHNKTDTKTGELIKLIHRDISPSNILISKDGNVKLTDFGIAKAVLGKREKTRVGEIKGKLSYMSPEQALGGSKKIDLRSDIFSLGIVFYELVTGRYAYEGDTDLEIHKKVVKADIDMTFLDKESISPIISNCIKKMLKKKPADRYEKVSEIKEELIKYLGEDEHLLQEELKVFVEDSFNWKPKEETQSDSREITPKIIEENDIGEKETYEESEIIQDTEETSFLDSPIISLPSERETDEEDESEKTRIDILIDSFRNRKQTLFRIFLGLVFFLLLLATIDTFTQITSFGQYVYAYIYRPDLIIESIPPNAKIILDGKLLEKRTPCEIQSLKQGQHHLRMESSGFIPFETTIAIGRQKEKIKKIFKFKKSVTILSQPEEAQVWINKNKFGKTPYSTQLPAGEYHNIKLYKWGFDTLKNCTVKLDVPVEYQNLNKEYWEAREKIVKENESKSLVLEGTLYKNIEFSSNPANTQLYVDSLHMGKLSSVLVKPVKYGRRQIDFKKSAWYFDGDSIFVDEELEKYCGNLYKKTRFLVYDKNDSINKTPLKDARITILRDNRYFKVQQSTSFRLLAKRYNSTISCDKYKIKNIIVYPFDFLREVAMELKNPVITIIVKDSSTTLPIAGALITDIKNNIDLGNTDSNGKCVIDSKIKPGIFKLRISSFEIIPKEIIKYAEAGENKKIVVKVNKIKRQ